MNEPQPTDAFRAWRRRCSRVGACLGLVIGYLMATTIPHLLMNLIIGPACGALVGAALGMVGALLSGRSARAIRTPAADSSIEGPTVTSESGPVVRSGPDA